MEDIFALDIGTRKVMGLVCRRTDDLPSAAIDGAVSCLEIIDMEVIEHTTRCMLDGQIHSIDEVARTVSLIRERLEGRLGRKLEKVGVAVAGRNLTTYKTRVEREFAVPEEVTAAFLKDVEMEGVDAIATDSGNSLSGYYCAGYSPVFYEVDGNRIGDPVGHKASTVAAEIIATFLPRIVLDSIRTVLRKAGLTATNITLEPISAMNAIIPQELRNLNIVLVDIGAGTSDLALARESQVFAYGMVPEAGDEITECISENLLCDFANAEKIKRLADGGGSIEYADIWDRPRVIEGEALKRLLSPAVAKLAGSIAATAVELNGAAPSAVVLVGGGALTPGLIPALAGAFGIPQYKVGIRLPSLIKGLIDRTGKLQGSEAVTPIGIALMTERAQGLQFIEAEVNGVKIAVLDFEQKKDVLGALTLSGALAGNKLHARPGLALTFTVNGEMRIIKGTFGSPAAIIRNGNPVEALSEKIENGDRIEFAGAIDGVDAAARVQDIVEIRPIQVFCNGQGMDLWPRVTIDGKPAALAAAVEDRCAVRVCPPVVSQALDVSGVRGSSLTQRQVLVNINGTPKILTQRNFSLTRNGISCDLDVELAAGDALEFSATETTCYRIRDCVEIPSCVEKMRVTVDGNEIELAVETTQVYMNGQQVNPDEFIIDGADIRVYHASERRVLLSEIFKYVNVDPQRVRGKRLRLLVNEVPAGFTTPLVEGSCVKIVFEDR